jgi:CelD/BcsL family acetyltransferase involved in cellulose biosynthesis
MLNSRALSGDEVMMTLTPEWDALAAANPKAKVFQTSSWYLAWIESVAAHERASPILLRVPADGKVRAAVALQLSGGEVEALRPLSWPWADYHDGVGSLLDREAIEALSRGVRELVAAQGRPLLLEDVVPGGMWESIVAHLPVSTSASSHTSAIELTDAAHIEHVLNRKEHVVKSRRLQRLGCVRCQHHLDVRAVLERFPALVRLHQEHWSDNPDAVAPFDGGVIDSAFECIIRHMAPRGQLILTELLLNDETIAAYLGFVHGGWYGAYRTAFESSYHRLSPGHLMLRQMILDFQARGLRELDLMRGDYSYKQEYANRYGRNKRFDLYLM